MSGDRYDETVNSLWPAQLPKPTGQEAIAGCQLLIREALRFYGYPRQVVMRRRTFRLTTGRRVTRRRRGVWHVNPDERGRGWMEIVHSVGHWAHGYRYPKLGGHDISHAAIERHLIRYVLDQGWLDGRLLVRRPDQKFVA